MKVTGKLTFNREPEGKLTYKWEGGRRVGISHPLYEQLANTKAVKYGLVFQAGPLRLRVVGLTFDDSEPQYYRSSIVVMREGLLARFAASYTENGFRWVFWWMRWKERVLRVPMKGNGESIPNWSLTGIILKLPDWI